MAFNFFRQPDGTTVVKERIIKVILLGESDVGKTTGIKAIKNYCAKLLTGQPTEPTEPTIGIDQMAFDVTWVATNPVGQTRRPMDIYASMPPSKIHVWDTAGQERFRTMTAAYYRETDVVVLIYDVMNPMTALSLGRMMREIQKAAGMDVTVVVVGNKSDMLLNKESPIGQQQQDKRAVGRDETMSSHGQQQHREDVAMDGDAAATIKPAAASLSPPPTFGRIPAVASEAQGPNVSAALVPILGPEDVDRLMKLQAVAIAQDVCQKKDLLHFISSARFNPSGCAAMLLDALNVCKQSSGWTATELKLPPSKPKGAARQAGMSKSAVGPTTSSLQGLMHFVGSYVPARSSDASPSSVGSPGESSGSGKAAFEPDAESNCPKRMPSSSRGWSSWCAVQ